MKGGSEAVKTTLHELLSLLGRERKLPNEFWKKTPIYISLGNGSPRKAHDAAPYDMPDGSSMVVDEDADGTAIGLELLP